MSLYFDAVKGWWCHQKLWYTIIIIQSGLSPSLMLCGKLWWLVLDAPNKWASVWAKLQLLGHLLANSRHPSVMKDYTTKSVNMHDSISVQVILMDSWLSLALPHVQAMHSHLIVLLCPWVTWMQSFSGEWMELQICVSYHRYQPILMIVGQMMSSQLVLGEQLLLPTHQHSVVLLTLN